MQSVVGESLWRLHDDLTTQLDSVQNLQARLSHREPIAMDQRGRKTVGDAGDVSRGPVLAGIGKRTLKLTRTQQRVEALILSGWKGGAAYRVGKVREQAPYGRHAVTFSENVHRGLRYSGARQRC